MIMLMKLLHARQTGLQVSECIYGYGLGRKARENAYMVRDLAGRLGSQPSDFQIRDLNTSDYQPNFCFLNHEWHDDEMNE
jgi:hypothetical protein